MQLLLVRQEVTKMPYLSVIVPIYQVEPYLRECVDSILAQEFEDMEIILVDDGSPDRCPEICEEYAGKDHRIRVIHQANGGIVRARKAGIAIASGRYVTFVDSDDWIDRGMYRTLYREAQRTDADIIITGAVVENDGRQEILTNPTAAGLYTGEKLKQLHQTMLYAGTFYQPGIYPVVWNKWFKREILKKNLNALDDTISLGEDMACTYPCLMDAKKVLIYGDKIFYHYRIRKDAMTKQDPKAAAGKYVRLHQYLEQVFPKEKWPQIAEQLDYHRAYLAAVVLLEEILKYNRIGSLKKGIRIAGECLSNENLQYLTDSLRIKQMRIPVSHRHVLLAYQNRKKTALLFWAQFGYISQHFFWTK